MNKESLKTLAEDDSPELGGKLVVPLYFKTQEEVKIYQEYLKDRDTIK